MLDKIFEMFTQVKRTGDSVASGLGIGLSLVKTLVELHGGRVEARSDGPGKGSEFTVRIPLENLDETTARAESVVDSGIMIMMKFDLFNRAPRRRVPELMDQPGLDEREHALGLDLAGADQRREPRGGRALAVAGAARPRASPPPPARCACSTWRRAGATRPWTLRTGPRGRAWRSRSRAAT